MNRKNEIILLIAGFVFFISLSFTCRSQSFLNEDIEGVVANSEIPYYWDSVPFTDPNCLANTWVSATVDMLDSAGYNSSYGMAGKPIVGLAFCSGLLSESTTHFWHEGIMQEVTGFCVNQSYTIQFYQSVVKQLNCIDTSGCWRVYLDNNLIYTSTTSTSHLAYDDINLQWDEFTLDFIATNTSHVIKFLPWDDDVNYFRSDSSQSGGLRMGIDGISLFKNQTTVVGDTICIGETANAIAACSSSYSWAAVSAPSTIISTNDTLVVAPNVTTNYFVYTDEDTVETTIVVGQFQPQIDFGQDTTLCQGETIIIDATTPNATYAWQDNSTNPTFNITQSGIYWAEVTSDYCTDVDTIIVNFNPFPPVDLGMDTTLCQGQSLILDVTTPNATYSWQDNSTNSFFDVTQQGSYWAEVSVSHCTTVDTIVVNFNPIPSFYLGNDTTICQNQTLTLDATYPGSSYSWQDNSTNSTININHQGIYWLAITLNNCTAFDSIYVNKIKCDVNIEMPNVFTPNNDGINDLFIPIQNIGIVSMNTIILNRWGNKIFETDSLQINWDGKNVTDGVYYWIIYYQDVNGNNNKLQGFVTKLID